jgi:hypothetical protein
MVLETGGLNVGCRGCLLSVHHRHGPNGCSVVTTLGSFHDMAGCKSAAVAVKAALQGGTLLAPVFCVSSADLRAFSNATPAQ